jgi:hypothetical protein
MYWIVWVVISVIFDAILTYIPCMILKTVRLEAHKRNALMVVFGANLLGSMTWYEKPHLVIQ